MTSRTGMMRGHSGFTLIEVLLAVVVLSTGIAFILFSLNNTLDALNVSRTNLRAHLLLKEALSDIQHNGPPAATHGTWRADWDSEFAFTIEDLPHGDLYGGELSEVIITVWRRGDSARYSVATYVCAHEDDNKVTER